MILVIDDFCGVPDKLRDYALASEYNDFQDGDKIFHGISLCHINDYVPTKIQWKLKLQPTLSFFRRSPFGQQEPNFIHTDEMMGDWTGILYLNPEPEEGDGTFFYGAEHSDSFRVAAQFNRLVLFSAHIPHSRALYDNYGTGNSARLTQVVFGTGDLRQCRDLI